MSRGTHQSYHERLNRVLVHIQEHLDDPLPLHELASVAHFSPYHFHRIFTGMTGETVKAYVRRLRLERAVKKLRFSDSPVTEIGLGAGYDSPSAFSRAFTQMFGRAPEEYRKLAREEGAGHVRLLPPLSLPQPQGGVPMEVAIKQVPKRKVAYVSHIGPYIECRAAWEKLCSWAGPKGLLTPETLFVGQSHDDPEVTPQDKIRYDACITIPDSVGPEGEVGIQDVGGGEYAVTLHKGPYELLHKTYAHLCGVWAPENGREVGDKPSLEIYLNAPGETPPEELRTEVHLPLA